MDQKQQLRQCIDDCRKTISQLESLASKAGDQRLKSTLNESVHHLDMCIRECEFAVKQVP